MEKISVSNVIVFKRKKNKGSQVTFINNLKNNKEENQNKDQAEPKGNYWVHALSIISTVFNTENNKEIGKKIDIINEKIETAKAKITKDMFAKNVAILHNFEDVNFADFKPKYSLNYLSKPKDKSILTLRGVPVQVLPNHVFTFKEKGIRKIGAIWFVSKKDGYTTPELGMFTDALYRYLKLHYSKEFEIVPEYCIAIDVTTLSQVNYTQILNKLVPSELNVTLDSISKMLN
jgi:hypothetical protein